MGIEVLLDLAADAAPERVAHGPSGSGETFAGLARRSAGGARLLAGTGARHVAYLGVQGPAFVTAVFAAARAGLPFTPLNYRLAGDEVAELLERLDDPVVLADADHRALVPADRSRVLDTAAWFAESAATAPADPPAEPSDVAVMLFTSGTTSRPKGVLLRHDHLMAYVLQSADPLAAGEDECALVCVPPYHVAGVASALSNVYAGRRVVHLPGFTPEGWLAAVRAESVTSALVVPTMLTRVVRALDGRPAGTPSLRSLAYGGAKVSPSILERALEAFPGTGFVNAYGLTETSSTVTVLGPEDHRLAVASADPAVRARLGSAGRPVPGVELQIRGPGGDPLPAGETGDLWIRGGQVSGEYAGRGSALDEHGWFPTRDRARLDAEGYLFVEGRGDDTIVRGGENIAPAEIETVLDRHPHVADVAVVGVPDEEWGQCTVAVVVPEPGTAPDAGELRAWCRERLRSSRTPDRIVLRGELPYSPTGKLLRRQVAAELAQQPLEIA